MSLELRFCPGGHATDDPTAPCPRCDAAAEVRARLLEAHEKRAAPEGFFLSWTSAHGLWGGGQTLTIKDGVLRLVGHAQRGGGGEDRFAERTLSSAEALAIVDVLVEYRIWEVADPERRGVPDESSIHMRVGAGDSEVMVWRWQRDASRFPPGFEPPPLAAADAPFRDGPMERVMATVFGLAPRLPPPPPGDGPPAPPQPAGPR